MPGSSGEGDRAGARRAATQPVLDAVRAERAAIAEAGRRGRAAMVGAWAGLSAAVVVSLGVWWWVGGDAVDAARSFYRDDPRPFAALLYTVIAALTCVGFVWTVARVVKTVRRNAVSSRWTRGVPFDCPRCRYRLTSPTSRCPECGWEAGG